MSVRSPADNPVRRWCRELDARLRAGDDARVEDYPTAGLTADDAVELVYAEFIARGERGEAPAEDDYLRRFPHLAAELRDQFVVHRALHDDRPPAATGQPVGPYRLGRELGRGSRGAVFAATDTRDGRAVAVKLLLSGEYATADDLALFRHEAAALARLDHPNLVRIHEAGTDAGRPYLALEYVAGPTLAQRAADFRAPAAAAALAETLARAVHHAHAQGVVHRDLKPANVLLGEGGPKVTDFGLAKLADAGTARTRTGDVVGTLGYMAPEQAAGAAHRAGPAADVYALGAILFDLLTGRPPFGSGPTAELLYRVLHDPPPAPHRLAPGVPRDLDTVCLRCLEKAPDRRYPSALALADDLRRFLDGKPVRARPVGAVGQGLRWARRRPTAAALVGTLLASAAGVTAGSLYYTARLSAALADSGQANADLTTALTTTEGLRAETRRQADAAERQLDDARRAMFAMQLAQLPAVSQREPVRGRTLLGNAKVCPPDLRDFTWRFFDRQCRLGEQGYAAHKGEARAVAVLADGRVASGGADGRLRYWTPGKPAAGGIVAHDTAVTGAAVVGDRVVTAGLDGRVKVWAAGATTPTRTITSPAAVNGLATDPTGPRVAGPCGDGAVRVWDIDTDAVTVLAGHAGPAHAAAFAPDGRTLVSGGADGTVRLWELPAGKAAAVWAGHAGPVLAVCVTPDGRAVVSGDDRGRVLVRDVAGGPARELRGHLLPVAAVAAVGDRILTAGGDTYLKVWDAATGQERTNLMQQHVHALAVTADGRRVVAGGRDGRVTVFDLPAWPPGPRFPHSANVAVVVPLPGGGAAVADAAGEVRVWGPDGVRGAFAVRKPDAGPVRRTQAVLGGDAPALAVSPDGRTLAVGGGGGEVVLWDLAAGTEAGRLAAHAGNVTAVAFRPDGALVTGGADAVVRVWDVARREAAQTLVGHTAGVLAVATSADGHWLATGGEDNTVRLWDAATGAAGPVFRGHTLWVLGLAFSPDGSRLASGSRDRTVRLWDVANAAATPVVISGFTNWVYAVGFAPDGRTLAAASGHYSLDTPGELKLCDPVSGYVRATLGDFRAPAAFAGRDRLLAGCRGGVVELVGK